MAPRNVAKPKKVAPVVEPTPVVVADDSESDDDGPSDFFGLSSSEPKRSKFEEISSAAGPSGFKINVQPTQHRGTYGPAKPTAEDEIEAEQPGAREPSKRDLSDEKAFNLIYKHEMQPWGFSDRKAAEALDKIVDVDMNQRLVDVRASLLRNMNSTQTAEVAATVTSRNSGQKAKPSRDINSKRKHQITYLADLAVSRDEQLREQWSNNRQAKIQSLGLMIAEIRRKTRILYVTSISHHNYCKD